MNESLAHFGVKGMRWGVRKDRQNGRAVAPKERSEDAVKVQEHRAKVKTHGVGALSNKELREVNERLNLERQFGQLSMTTQQQTVKFVTDFLKKQGPRKLSTLAKGHVNLVKNGSAYGD